MKAMILLITLSNSAEFSQSGIVVLDQSHCEKKKERKKEQKQSQSECKSAVKNGEKPQMFELMIIRGSLMRCK